MREAGAGGSTSISTTPSCAPDQRAVLDSKLPVLKANPGVRIRIDGNADERGSDEYNLALGMRRAQATRKYLIDSGIDAGRIDVASNGEEKPVCQGHDEDCWKQNRRDEFVIIAGGVARGHGDAYAR